jgi:hypothetical protein
MLCASVCMVVAPRGLAVKLQTPGSVRAGALTWLARAATDSTIDKQPTPTRDWAPRQRYRPTGSVPADARVAHLRCRGLRLWHHESAHRGVHGDTSRAIVSLPSHGVMVCEISSDGPPHVFAEMVRVWLSVNLKRHGVDCGGTVGRIGPWTRADRSQTCPHLGHNLDTGGKPIQRCARPAREKSLPREFGFEGHIAWAEAMR